MASSYLIRLGRIKGNSGILTALQHNKRTLQAEHGAKANIDTSKTSLNYCLIGDIPPKEIANLARAKMALAGIYNPRINGVMAVEVVFSLPINRHRQDTRSFFVECMEWVSSNLSGELLSFDVHLDESAPHAHAIILPLVEGKMQGNKLIGNRGNLMRLINLFHKDVACRYGLSRSNHKKTSHSDKRHFESLVLMALKHDSVLKSKIWPCVRDAIHNDPLPYAQILNVDSGKACKKAKKTFVEIMISRGKGKANEYRNAI
jgi:hypothetical protein